MNRESFSILVQQQSRKLYGFAFRILRNREEAEDVVQEIFLKLWNMREKLCEYRSIEALAATITRNHCIDLIRKQKNEYRDEIDLNNYSNLSVNSPFDNMVLKESGMIIERIIEKLPDNIRTVLRLHDIDGKSYEEIAEITGHNINTLRVNISRARKIIRDEFNIVQNEKRGN
jgi:RNA polymerase sigma-70 factor, ECF subfamily